MYYAKDIDQKEIDILYHSSGSLYLIEIKKGVNPTKPNKNFNVLKNNLDIEPGLIIDNTEKTGLSTIIVTHFRYIYLDYKHIKKILLNVFFFIIYIHTTIQGIVTKANK